MKSMKRRVTMLLATIGIVVLFPSIVSALEMQRQSVTDPSSGNVIFKEITSAQEFAGIVSASLNSEQLNQRQTKGYFGEAPTGSLYELKRIIVSGDVFLADTYGAENAYVFEAGNEYILEYATGEDTASAYESLVSDYGEEQVLLDQKFSLEEYQISSDITTASAVSPDLWGIELMGLDDLKKDAEGVWTEKTVVAVVDTGIDIDHPWFKNRISKDSVSLISGETYEDQTGHGTHVAGIIAQGTSSAVDIMVVRLFNDEGETTISLLLAAVDYINEKNPDVVNMSLGKANVSSTAWDTALLESKFEKFLNTGGVICASAGNNSTSAALFYPASSSHTITVSSLSKSITEPVSYYFSNSFSNYGSLIDFAAPGEQIESAWLNGGTKFLRGTSMSCPHVTAAAAMVKNRHSEYNQEMVYQELVNYAVDMGTAGKDEYFGHGYIDMANYFSENPVQNNPAINNPVQNDPATNNPSQKGQKEQTISVPKDSYQKIYGASRFSLQAKGNGILSYKSSNPSVAAVDQKGMVTIKGVGKASITIKASATPVYKSVSRTISVTVKPQKVNVKKATGKKKKVQLSWKKLSYASGYQIRYSTKSNMKSAKKCTVNRAKTTSKVIGSLKSKKVYYLQVRGFKKVSGVTYYGEWSKPKKTRTK